MNPPYLFFGSIRSRNYRSTSHVNPATELRKVGNPSYPVTGNS